MTQEKEMNHETFVQEFDRLDRQIRLVSKITIAIGVFSALCWLFIGYMKLCM